MPARPGVSLENNFLTMKLDINPDGTISIMPWNKKENRILRNILKFYSKHKIEYAYRHSEKDSFGLSFKTGPKMFRITGYQRKDQAILMYVRNALYLGGLTRMLREHKTNTKQPWLILKKEFRNGRHGINMTITTCKTCGNPVNHFSEVEWQVCENCRKHNCVHVWKNNATINDNWEIGYGSFCKECGLGNPNPIPESSLPVKEQHKLLMEENPNLTII